MTLTEASARTEAAVARIMAVAGARDCPGWEAP